MRVQLIANTKINPGAIDEHMDTHVNVFDSDADVLAEFSGRACYQSFHRPNPKTRANPHYLRNILDQGHESVLEHSSATFYVEGVSRALTHELIRHRHLSFSELSQRFVNVEEARMVMPPAIRGAMEDEAPNVPPEGFQEHYNAAETFDEMRREYQACVAYLRDRGLPRKQAREAARAVMPNATETKIVVTGNHRAWRDVLKKRWSTHADAEICEFAGEILKHLKVIAPGHFQDIPDKPYGTEEN